MSQPSLPPQTLGPVRVRIAPSPTGDPHVGTAYIALFNYVFAKKHGGKFLLRIEDTDRTRSTKESEAAILRALSWVGLAWDEGPDKGGPFGPYRQSERSAIYKAHADRLVDKGEAYRCFCTEAELEAMRAEQKASGKSHRYEGRCRALPADEVAAKIAAGLPHVVRLKVPAAIDITFTDELRGDITFSTNDVDDQVLLKSDGFPTYHLANVVDDHLMEISHVIRAEEWISSTPKHVLLYRAFGWTAPRFIHMPLLRNSDKSKISKRKNPVSLDYYRDAGILPEALLNFLGLMGFSFGGDREKFTLDEMVEVFDWSKISLGGPVFDLEKLTWLNSLYLHALTPEGLVARLRESLLSDERLVALATLLKERVRRLDEFIPAAEYFLSGDLDHSKIEGLVPKGKTAAECAAAIGDLVEQLDGVVRWEVAILEPLVREATTKLGWKTKDLFGLVRLAVTGRSAAPPLFDTMALVGKERTRRRLRKAIEFLRTQP